MLDGKTKAFIKKTIFSFFDPGEVKVFVFGSQATGKNKRFSDIDVGIKSTKKIPWWKLSAIEGVFEESELPQTVDVVDFNLVSDSFRQVAEKKLIHL